MKKFLMLAAVVALVAAALALPAMAQNNGGVNFDDCFPFCDDNSEANQSFDQGARNFDDSDNNRFDDDEGRFFDRFDDEDDFFDFFDDRFNDDFDDFNNDDAAISQEIGQESESGDVAIGFDVSSSGDYAQQCVAPLQFGNTGNLQNAQGFLQYNSEADDVEFDGSSFVFAPSVETACDQAVQQSAAASSR